MKPPSKLKEVCLRAFTTKDAEQRNRALAQAQYLDARLRGMSPARSRLDVSVRRLRVKLLALCFRVLA